MPLADMPLADMPTLQLTTEEHAMIGGEAGPAAQLAARLVVRMAGIMGADRLVPIAAAHVDGCLYHGPVSTDFAKKLVDGGGKVKVPTTLNVGSVDLLHPELYRGDAETAKAGRELMRLYAALGCRATWTCAPYQLQQRPSFGQHVAWAESNAIVFANSVLGARTERYGDFIDIAAALIGRAPYAGLHRDEGRFARVVFRLRGITQALAESDVLFAALGHLIGRRAGGEVAAIDGLSHATEDQLKALGAAAASSGSVAMFHVIGVTPEAPTLEAACGGNRTNRVSAALTGSDISRSAESVNKKNGERAPRVIDLSIDDLAAAARELSSAAGDSETLGAISVGTPHFSVAEFQRLVTFLDGRRVSDRVEFFVSTGRDVLTHVTANGWLDDLTRAGVRIVTDTCTYITPILTGRPGAVMTNSAKWAWYAPNNLGLRVIFGSLRECVESAVRGEVWRDASLWRRAE
jgi:predicted aconitase